MRLLTWNVLWRFAPDWKARERAILDVLERLQPDVIGLQECWATAERSQADVVAERLGASSAFLPSSLPPIPDPVEHDDQVGVGMGIGLVSRWPISSLRGHKLPVTHRQVGPIALAATIEHPDRPFEVLVAATEWEPDFADDHLAQTTRLARLLLADSPTERFLLADLNCDASQAEFAPLTVGIDDTWELAGGDPHAVTLSSAVPFAPLEAVKEIDRRIDHIMIRRGADVAFERTFVVDAPVDGLFHSDHFPVVLDVRLLSPAGSSR